MKKNTKLDLIWIIPEIIGSLGITYIAIKHIHYINFLAENDVFEYFFQLCLSLIVINTLGIKGFVKGFALGLDEFKKIRKNQ